MTSIVKATHFKNWENSHIPLVPLIQSRQAVKKWTNQLQAQFLLPIFEWDTIQDQTVRMIQRDVSIEKWKYKKGATF